MQRAGKPMIMPHACAYKQVRRRSSSSSSRRESFQHDEKQARVVGNTAMERAKRHSISLHTNLNRSPDSFRLVFRMPCLLWRLQLPSVQQPAYPSLQPPIMVPRCAQRHQPRYPFVRPSIISREGEKDYQVSNKQRTLATLCKKKKTRTKEDSQKAELGCERNVGEATPQPQVPAMRRKAMAQSVACKKVKKDKISRYKEFHPYMPIRRCRQSSKSPLIQKKGPHKLQPRGAGRGDPLEEEKKPCMQASQKM